MKSKIGHGLTYLQNGNRVIDTENRLVIDKGRRSRKDGLGIWDEQMQTIICKMGGQQEPAVSHREFTQYPVINYNGNKEYEKECIYV